MDTEINSTQLFDLLESGKKVCLVDVREEEELLLSSLPNAIHIPLMSLPEKVEDLSRMSGDKSYDYFVLICRSGQRSEMARQWLVAQGIESFRNLVGGLNEYGKTCDSSVVPY